MSLFDRATFILTANAYKAGKLYSLKGHDIPFSRGSSATRINSSGLLELVGSNVPRLKYTSGVPKILIEPASQNINTTQYLLAAGASVVNLNSVISPSGETNAHYVQFGNIATDAPRILEQLISALPNTQYTLSYWAKSISGNGRIQTRVGTDVTSIISNKTIIATSAWSKFFHTFTTDATASSFPANRIIFRNDANNLGEVHIYGMQLEVGGAATSYMPPSALTRSADQPTSFNTVSLGYLLASQGSIVVNDTVYKYTTDGNLETFVGGVSQGTSSATPPTSWTLPVGETERVLMFDYPLTTTEINAL